MNNRSQLRSTLVATAVALGVMMPSVMAQESELPEIFSEAIPLYTKALGRFERPISSSNADAQAYFNQGYQMMYAFAKIEAVRSFREAWKADTTCAICYWGEAWGSYLNGQIREQDAPHAYAAIQHAIELAPAHATPNEQAFINAMSVRYVENYDPENRVQQDEAYADAMKRVADEFPDNLDAVTLYGEALFLLEPRRGTRDINDPNVQRLHRVLEGVLAKDIAHPGSCHLYIHATESTVDPGRAAPCAELLGTSIPGASHINHMPSHTWNEIGRWNDGVRSNLMAWHSDQKAEIGEGFDIYPSHNLHMLLFAASMDGQGAIAIQAGKDYAKVTGDGLYHALTLLRFGRFEEILSLDVGRRTMTSPPACGTSHRVIRTCETVRLTLRGSISTACSRPPRPRRTGSAFTTPNTYSESSETCCRGSSSGTLERRRQLLPRSSVPWQAKTS